jgi:glycosidase
MDADYSWDMHNAITAVFQGKKPASAIREAWQKQHDTFPRNALHMRFSDNHDERRAIVRFGERGALAAQALAFTLDGIPLVYNGMEVGDTAESGAPALFENLQIFWPVAEKRPEFPRFYQRMIALRKSSEALRRGDLEWVANTNDACVISYLRHAKTEDALVVINACSTPVKTQVTAPAGNFAEVTPDITADSPKPLPPTTLPNLSLESWSFHVYRHTN